MNALSIILPCFNPPEGWEQIVVSSIGEISQTLGLEPQLIIINDGSKTPIDKAIAFIEKAVPNFIYINNADNKGKGFALRTGIRKANAVNYIYTDIDFPYSIDSFLAVYQALCKGFDVVAGIKDAGYYAHTPFIRKQISKLLRFMIRNFLSMPVTDTQCGLKGFNNRGKELFLATTIDRYLFDLEFIYLSSRKSNPIRLTSIEASLRPGISFRRMNPAILYQEGKNFLKILLK